jgi:uncharacterized protein YqgC (DUF456 family)
MAVGVIGGILGFFLLGSFLPIFGNLIGGILGYSLGVLVGQFMKFKDWNIALKATLGGIVGWGLATVIQVVGGVLMMIIFIWQVFAY